MKPITPAELKKSIVAHPAVLQAINELLQESGKANNITLYQKDITKRITKLDKKLTSTYVFANHLLDIEDVYREAGWKVVYDKPGYNESYEAHFTFKL